MSEGKFCCFWSLQAGAFFAANFTLTLSAITCAVASSVFFNSKGANDGHSKLTAFSIISYSVLFIYISRKLVQRIEEDDRETLFMWLTMATISVVFLISGPIFVLISYSKGLIDENAVSFATVIAVSTLCLIIAVLLAYFIWKLVALWIYMGEDHEDAEAV